MTRGSTLIDMLIHVLFQKKNSEAPYYTILMTGLTPSPARFTFTIVFFLHQCFFIINIIRFLKYKSRIIAYCRFI